jgi:DNA-directed RNA polymerase specialized sigma subunit
MQIAKYIDELDEKERTVISLYYYEELNSWRSRSS